MYNSTNCKWLCTPSTDVVHVVLHRLSCCACCAPQTIMLCMLCSTDVVHVVLHRLSCCACCAPQTIMLCMLCSTDVLHVLNREARARRFAFQILATGSKYHLAAESGEERQRWVQRLEGLLFGPSQPGIICESVLQRVSTVCFCIV